MSITDFQLNNNNIYYNKYNCYSMNMFFTWSIRVEFSLTEDIYRIDWMYVPSSTFEFAYIMYFIEHQY